MDAKTLWNSILTELEMVLSRGSFKTFFGNSRPVSFDNNLLTISLVNGQVKDFVERRYSQVVLEIAQRVAKKNIQLSFVVKKGAEIKSESGPLFEEKPEEKTPTGNLEAARTLAAKIRLRPDFTLETFAVSGSNQLAHAAAQAVIRSPGNAYNPLYLWGGVGVGKTHLMQAVGNELLFKNSGIKIVYVTSEQFTNEITVGIRNKTMDKFRDKYRSAQCLFMDDVQFIAGKDSTQEEFFHTFNVIRENGGQIILTSDKPPSQIELLEDRIRSRFEQGLVIDIAPPDFELRTAILLIKAKQKNVELSMPVAQFVAEKILETRQLEGILTRLIAESRIKEAAITVDLTAKIIGKPAPLVKKASVTDVLRLIASYYGIKINDLRGERRKKEFVFPRQVSMWFLHKELELTLEQTGKELGGRDHTTVIHGCDKINWLLQHEEEIKKEVLGIKQRLSG